MSRSLLHTLGVSILLAGALAPFSLAQSRPNPLPTSLAVATLTPAEVQQQLQIKPETAQDYYNLGLVAQGQGDFPQAIAYFTAAINQQGLADYYFARGLAQADLGDHLKALADYDKAIDLDPNFSSAFYNRGMTYLALQNLPAAVSNFDQAIALDAEFVAAYYSRGMAYFDMGKIELARQDYNRSLSLSPTMTASYYDQAPRPLTGGGDQ